jgi:hypothetical protein
MTVLRGDREPTGAHLWRTNIAPKSHLIEPEDEEDKKVSLPMVVTPPVILPPVMPNPPVTQQAPCTTDTRDARLPKLQTTHDYVRMLDLPSTPALVAYLHATGLSGQTNMAGREREITEILFIVHLLGPSGQDIDCTTQHIIQAVILCAGGWR